MHRTVRRRPLARHVPLAAGIVLFLVIGTAPWTFGGLRAYQPQPQPPLSSAAATQAQSDAGPAVSDTADMQPAPDMNGDESADQQVGDTVSASSQVNSPLDSIRTYVVEAGDNVRSIATQFGISNETIIWENDLSDPNLLEVGQSLRILPFSGLVHEVRPGDTVASIANGYGAKVDDMIQANHLAAPYIILVGQQLLVPGGYRALPAALAPQLPIVAPRPSAPDVVQVPKPLAELQAAAAPTPAKPLLPVLGNTPQEQFIASVGLAAIQSQQATGVPASVTIAQAILESYWGSSRLSAEDNNYFGIKAETRPGPAGVVWLTTWEVVNGRDVQESQPFRVYHTMAESFVDHGNFFIENSRYAAAMAVRNDAKAFAVAINRAGYATDPGYATKLIALMDRYNLYQWDHV